MKPSMLPRACLVLVLAATPTLAPAADRHEPGAPSPFSRFVDRYLASFSRYHPSIAAGNGIHDHDGDLEDFSAPVIRAEVVWLRSTRHALDSMDEVSLTPDECVDRRILQGIVDGWLLDLDTVRSWRRNPMVYVAALSDGLHDLVTMDSSPPEHRATQIISKLRGIPRLMASARRNIVAPPRLFVERSIVMLGGVSELLSHDLPLAFTSVHDAALRQRLARAAASAVRAIDAYRKELETRGLASATGSYAIGTAAVEARYRAEELIDLDAATLLAIGERELASTQATFARTAAQVDARRPALEVWRGVQKTHPAPGELAPAARALVDELFAFIDARHLVELPANEHVTVIPAPAYDLGLASMHSSPPLEPHPVQSFYYVTDADPTWPVERQNTWLEAFNYATLADITAHEVAPGHYVHSLFMHQTPGKIRRIWVGLNPFPQPSSGQDGWAHYAEQMVSDEGFRADDPRYRLAQTAEALTRICRLIAGLKLHSGEWTVEQATDLFEQHGHLIHAAAYREAVRGTYDPTYGGYFLGKLAALKLRRDYQAARGDAFSLREFHERVMTNGIAPWWAHRQLMLTGDTRPVVE